MTETNDPATYATTGPGRKWCWHGEQCGTSHPIGPTHEVDDDGGTTWPPPR